MSTAIIVPILYTVIAVNLMLALMIFSRGIKKSFSILFGLTTVGVILWSISIVGFYIVDLSVYFNWAKVAHFSAIFLAVSFLHFSFVFPRTLLSRENIYFYVPTVILIIASYFIFLTNRVIGEVSEVSYHIGDLYLLYGTTLATVFFVGFIFLYLQKNKTTNIHKQNQIKFIFIGAALSSLLALLTDLILPGLGIFSYLWVGPLATVLLVISLFIAIIKYGLFEINILVTEFFSVLLILGLLTEVLFADSVIRLAITGTILVFSVIMIYLLIRSVAKQIEAKEKIESLAEDLKEANVRLKELDQQKSEFVSIASHQLRSPLTAIRGYASLLLDGSFGELNKTITKPIGNILESSQRLVSIVEDFLNVTRIEQGRMKYSFLETDIKKLGKSVVDELSFTAKQKNLSLEFTNDGKSEYLVNIDVVKMRQVIFNIIDNAIKYTTSGGIKINISKKIKDKKILISVSDTGMGISKDFKDSLFKKFSRSKTSNDFHANGSGIGLYIANEIIKGHNGNIWAESEGSKKGSTFFIELPMV